MLLLSDDIFATKTQNHKIPLKSLYEQGMQHVRFFFADFIKLYWNSIKIVISIVFNSPLVQFRVFVF